MLVDIEDVQEHFLMPFYTVTIYQCVELNHVLSHPNYNKSRCKWWWRCRFKNMTHVYFSHFFISAPTLMSFRLFFFSCWSMSLSCFSCARNDIFIKSDNVCFASNQRRKSDFNFSKKVQTKTKYTLCPTVNLFQGTFQKVKRWRSDTRKMHFFFNVTTQSFKFTSFLDLLWSLSGLSLTWSYKSNIKKDNIFHVVVNFWNTVQFFVQKWNLKNCTLYSPVSHYTAAMLWDTAVTVC